MSAHYLKPLSRLEKCDSSVGIRDKKCHESNAKHVEKDLAIQRIAVRDVIRR